uniref:Uncharacterized protein AlNc14C36G3215 n=1 Tax=Albugo laibachii Nc14 TaxID=890382 RepID=F0W8U1_9STRA|nr:conserved hypothetical protein [Albugo laibachii Nc14]|eukprot:CCA17550.1 conserved hypothetical protein [Albugo laibachii Nc14]
MRVTNCSNASHLSRQNTLNSETDQQANENSLRTACSKRYKSQEKWFERISDVALPTTREVGEYSHLQHGQHRELTMLAVRLYEGIVSGDRRKNFFKTYHNCFTGCEAIDWMLKAHHVTSLHIAIQQAQALLRERYVLPADRQGNRFEYSKKRFYRFTTRTRKFREATFDVPSDSPLKDHQAFSFQTTQNQSTTKSDINLQQSSISVSSSFTGNRCSLSLANKPEPVFRSVSDFAPPSSPKKASVHIEPINFAARQRAVAALVGAFVAEAASTSLNGVPNPVKKFPDFLSNSSDPAFFDAKLVNELCDDKKRRFLLMFDEQSYFDEALNISNVVKESSTGIESRIVLHCIAHIGHLDDIHQLRNDIYWLYKQHFTLLSRNARDFVKSMEKGKSSISSTIRSRSIDVLALLPPVVALYAGTDHLFDKVKKLVQIFSRGSRVLDMATVAAYILEQIILGASILEALRRSIRCSLLSPRQRKYIYKAFTKAQLSSHEAILKYGNEGNLPRGLYTILQPLFVSTSYTNAVRENIIGGGRSCRRAMFLGACFAAQDGIRSIPSMWLAQTPQFESVKVDIRAIVQQRNYFHLHSISEGELYAKRKRVGRVQRRKLVNELVRSNAKSASYLKELQQLEQRCTGDMNECSKVSHHAISSYVSEVSSGSTRLSVGVLDLGDLHQYYPPSSRRSMELASTATQRSRIHAASFSHTTAKRAPPPQRPSFVLGQ